MTTSQSKHHRLIEAAVMRRPQAIVEQTVLLWERLAVELISIIGDGGFQLLYARSMHLCNTQFPWLLPDQAPGAGTSRFSSLQACLEQRSTPESCAASIGLLATFIDILAMLIGDPLTTSLLKSAWSDEVLGSAKEFEHE